jgi:hypothetical protein
LGLCFFYQDLAGEPNKHKNASTKARFKYGKAIDPYFDKGENVVIKTIIKEYGCEYFESKPLIDLYSDYIEIQNRTLIDIYSKNLDVQREIACSGATQSVIDSHKPKEPNFWYFDSIAYEKFLNQFYG